MTKEEEEVKNEAESLFCHLCRHDVDDDDSDDDVNNDDDDDDDDNDVNDDHDL